MLRPSRGQFSQAIFGSCSYSSYHHSSLKREQEWHGGPLPPPFVLAETLLQSGLRDQ